VVLVAERVSDTGEPIRAGPAVSVRVSAEVGVVLTVADAVAVSDHHVDATPNAPTPATTARVERRGR